MSRMRFGLRETCIASTHQESPTVIIIFQPGMHMLGQLWVDGFCREVRAPDPSELGSACRWAGPTDLSGLAQTSKSVVSPPQNTPLSKKSMRKSIFMRLTQSEQVPTSKNKMRFVRVKRMSFPASREMATILALTNHPGNDGTGF